MLTWMMLLSIINQWKKLYQNIFYFAKKVCSRVITSGNSTSFFQAKIKANFPIFC